MSLIHDVFGVPVTASSDEIISGYRGVRTRLMKLALQPGMGERANIWLSMVDNMYTTLNRPERRQVYESRLTCRNCGGATPLTIQTCPACGMRLPELTVTWSAAQATMLHEWLNNNP